MPASGNGGYGGGYNDGGYGGGQQGGAYGGGGYGQNEYEMNSYNSQPQAGGSLNEFFTEVLGPCPSRNCMTLTVSPAYGRSKRN